MKRINKKRVERGGEREEEERLDKRRNAARKRK